RLAEHDEATGIRIPRAQVNVREPTVAAAGTPLGREHDEVERLCRLHFEPRRSPSTCLIARVQRFGHEPFLTRGDRTLEERGSFTRVRRPQPRDERRDGHGGGELFKPAAVRLVEQRDAVRVEDVEEERRERQLVAQTIHVELPPEAAHGHLERQRRSVGTERDRLTVEYDIARLQRAGDLYHFGYRLRHVVQLAGKHLHSLERFVYLDAS